MPNRTLLGVATVQDINHGFESSRMGSCGLVKWCYSMAHFVSYLQDRAELVVLTNDAATVKELCMQPRLRVVPLDRTLGPLIINWTLMLNYSRYIWVRQLSLRALYKLQLFSMTEYRSILFTDVDVDPFLLTGGRPPAASSRAGQELELVWNVALSRFLNSKVNLVASLDRSSPINTGVMLLKPSMRIYLDGVGVLQRRNFDPFLGFDGAGRPRDALAHLQSTSEWHRINSTHMLTVNDWNFVGGHACQGLFVHLFLVRSDATMSRFEFPKNRTFRRAQGLGTMRMHHFTAGTKPWRVRVRCPSYFDFLAQDDVPKGNQTLGATAGFCWRHLRKKRDCLMRGLSKKACRECRRMNLASLCAAKNKVTCSGTSVNTL